MKMTPQRRRMIPKLLLKVVVYSKMERDPRSIEFIACVKTIAQDTTGDKTTSSKLTDNRDCRK